MEYCLPKYRFFVLDDTGWNFRYGHFHQENRRTLTKAYGFKFVVKTTGRASRFDLTSAVIIIGNFMGVIGIMSMVYDWIIINYPSDTRKKIREVKYDVVEKCDAQVLLKFSKAAKILGVLPNQIDTEPEKEKDSVALETIRSMMTATSSGVFPEQTQNDLNKTIGTNLERIARSERLI